MGESSGGGEGAAAVVVRESPHPPSFRIVRPGGAEEREWRKAADYATRQVVSTGVASSSSESSEEQRNPSDLVLKIPLRPNR